MSGSPPESTALAGACRCGAHRYRITGAPRWVAHCHCEDCRRSSGAPFVTWVGAGRETFAWLGPPPQRYESSPGTQRSFCGRCGTPLTFESHRWPDEVHVLAGTLESPLSLKPQAHVYTRHQLPWIRLADGLRTLKGTSDDP